MQVGVARLGRAGQHERHPRLVDQDRVGLVDQGHVGLGHRHGGGVGQEPVAEDVEPDLAHGRVGHLRRVRPPPLRRAGGLADAADRDAQQVVQRAHPVRVPAGEVVVDRHDVHRPAARRVGGGRQRAGQGLALAGGHLGDLPGQHDERAEQLRVVGTLTQRPAGGLPPHGAEPGPVLHAGGQAGQRRVRQVAQRVLTRGDLRKEALVRGQIGRPRLLQEPPHPPAEKAHRTWPISIVMVSIT